MLDDDFDAAALVAVELSTAMRGYKPEEVDALIDRAADALEARDALLRTTREDRDHLLAELDEARRQRDDALTGVVDAESAARQAVEDARRLRERVQERAESLLADAARRADELRAQGRAEGAAHVTEAQAEARAIVADAERRRDEHEADLQRRWQDLRRALDDTERRATRARQRLREELERALQTVTDWEARTQTEADETTTSLDEVQERMSTPPPRFPRAADEPAESEPSESTPALAGFLGMQEEELADLEGPWDLEDPVTTPGPVADLDDDLLEETWVTPAVSVPVPDEDDLGWPAVDDADRPDVSTPPDGRD